MLFGAIYNENLRVDVVWPESSVTHREKILITHIRWQITQTLDFTSQENILNRPYLQYKNSAVIGFQIQVRILSVIHLAD